VCPEAVTVPPRFDRYQEVSATIMKVFSDFSPDVEALSLDEAFIDMTGSERLFGSPESIGGRAWCRGEGRDGNFGSPGGPISSLKLKQHPLPCRDCTRTLPSYTVKRS
jgi:nucleotidyltransferase/DNA polymerase involved in DNA repair